VTRQAEFSLPHHLQTASEAHTAFYPVDTGAHSPGVKRPGREAEHSPPFSVDVNASSYTSPPPYVFMALYLLKHRDNFILPYFTLPYLTSLSTQSFIITLFFII